MSLNSKTRAVLLTNKGNHGVTLAMGALPLKRVTEAGSLTRTRLIFLEN